jgi:hypothetical protein
MFKKMEAISCSMDSKMVFFSTLKVIIHIAFRICIPTAARVMCWLSEFFGDAKRRN